MGIYKLQLRFIFVEIYYACYYPEGEEFRERIASIVNYFRQNGYNVTMDVMVSGEITSQGPTRWAESQMRKARKVMVFLSPGLLNLALDGQAESSQSQVFVRFGWLFIVAAVHKSENTAIQIQSEVRVLAVCYLHCKGDTKHGKYFYSGR